MELPKSQFDKATPFLNLDNLLILAKILNELSSQLTNTITFGREGWSVVKAAYLPYSGAAPLSERVENLSIIVLPSVHLTYVFCDIFRFAHSEEQSFTSTMKIDAKRFK